MGGIIDASVRIFLDVVSANRSHVQKLEAETKAYLKAGDRATAAKFALELQKAKGAAAIEAIDGSKTFGSKAAADDYLARVRHQIVLANRPTTTTTIVPTTTTLPPTTTVPGVATTAAPVTPPSGP